MYGNAAIACAPVWSERNQPGSIQRSVVHLFRQGARIVNTFLRGAGRLGRPSPPTRPRGRGSAQGRQLGPREYEWTLPTDQHAARGDRPTYLLVRRTLDEGRLTAYLAFAPVTCSLAELALAAGARWAIERCSKPSRNWAWISTKCGPWHGWYRHITLVMAAHAFLVGCRQRVLKKPLPLPDRPVTVTVSLADLRRWLGSSPPTGPLSHRNCMLHWFPLATPSSAHRSSIFITGGDATYNVPSPS